MFKLPKLHEQKVGNKGQIASKEGIFHINVPNVHINVTLEAKGQGRTFQKSEAHFGE